MIWIEISIAFFSALIFLVPVYFGFKDQKLPEKKDLWTAAFGFITSLLTIFHIVFTPEPATKEVVTESAQKIIDRLKADSVNNAGFQTYVRDTFGIERQGNTASITNIVTYKNVIGDRLPKDETTSLKAETNYTYRISGDTFFIAPKEGVWIRSIFHIDTSKRPSFNEGIGRTYLEQFTIDGKKYETLATTTSERSVTNDMPFYVIIRNLKDTYVIFGDDADPSKKYFYKSGKVKWIPNYATAKKELTYDQFPH